MRRQLIAAASIAALAPQLSARETKVDESNFAELHALIQPRPDELAWQSIPWRTNLWEARIDAARTGKPIYLWEMDGHPMGCT